MSEGMWYYTKGEKPIGPLSFTQLQQMAAAMIVIPGDKVIQRGDKRWRRAETVTGLFPETSKAMTTEKTEARMFMLWNGDSEPIRCTLGQLKLWIANGKIHRQMPVCAVGGEQWLPVHKILDSENIEQSSRSTTNLPAQSAITATFVPQPEIQPKPVVVARPVPRPDDPVEPSVSGNAWPRRRSMRITNWILDLITVSIMIMIAFAVYGIYEWIRPLSPTEVCKRSDESKSINEAKMYVTPRMHGILEIADFNDNDGKLELLGEEDGNAPRTIHVRYRHTNFDKEWGRRLQTEGYFKLIRSNGWKIDDIIILGKEGHSVEGAVSLVDAINAQKHPEKFTKPLPAITPIPEELQKKPQPQSRQPTPKTNPVNSSSGAGVIIFAIIAGIFYWIREGIRDAMRHSFGLDLEPLDGEMESSKS